MNLFERTVRIVAFSAVAAVAILQGYLLLRPPQRSSVAVEGLLGRKVEQMPPATAGSKGALIASLATTCIYCTASAPFYKKLIAEVLPSKNGIVSVAFMPEERAKAEEYLEEVVGTTFSSIVRGKPLGVMATPTLMLVDSQGTVKNAWVGQLSSDKEQQVIEAIDRLAR